MDNFCSCVEGRKAGYSIIWFVSSFGREVESLFACLLIGSFAYLCEE